VDRLDAGPILVQRETMIGPCETRQELHDRLARVGCDALDTALALHESDPLPAGEPQDESRATRAPKLRKADGYVRFNEPAELIARQCRAYWPWPGARCRYVAASGQGVDVTLGAATVIPTDADAAPGTVTRVLTVATGAGCVEIHSLQPAGKRLMGWLDFVNGRHVQPGDRFEFLGG
jgi:methionyl-tRNA formyltransferase